MPIINRIADYHTELTEIRQQIHANPELLFDVFETAELIVEKLKEYGVDQIVTGIGRTGVVAVIKGDMVGEDAKVIGLRADMDALPITEASKLDYVSKNIGKMHACGHDGHSSMLLGAAKYLAETRNFCGEVVCIFQPAEEGGGGGKEMVDDGMMERFNIDEVYGMHTYPDEKLGTFAIRKGAVLASADFFTIDIVGLGSHAAKSHTSIDPIIIGADIVQTLQSITSRSVDPMAALVISVTQFNAGTADNVIAQTASLSGTVRSLSPKVRDLAQKRITEIVNGVVGLHGGKVELEYRRNYPVMSNHADQVDVAADIADLIVGEENVERDVAASMGAEDFAFMLNKRPDAMIFISQGPGPELHHPEFNFNDEIIPIGVSFWVKLAETRLNELATSNKF
ncbi:MAG: amidohydrolase [Rhizobiales bacterium]|nr:amidohydrolase [Hyphomicrobiales bacterium]